MVGNTPDAISAGLGETQMPPDLGEMLSLSFTEQGEQLRLTPSDKE